MAPRILAVDDFEPWRRFVSSALERQLGLQTLLQASDGLEAVSRAADVRPDLVLLDIGLPTLDGIKTARRIRELSPNSKILFLTEESSPDVAEAALAVGGSGYVVKSDARRELSAAVEAVIDGKRYISAKLVGRVFFDIPDTYPAQVHTLHGLQIYCNDASFVDGFTSFIADGLSSGNAVVVLAVEAHRQGLVHKLKMKGFDLQAITETGCYICVDVIETLSSFMVDGQPDPDQLGSKVSSLVQQASTAPNGATRRVSACGECAPFLWTQGNLDAALRLEELWDVAAHKNGLRTLCGYVSKSFQVDRERQIFQRICGVHSTVIPCDHAA